MIRWLLFGVLLACIFYTLFLHWIIRRWQAGEAAYTSIGVEHDFPMVSVLVPARNEAANIKYCLHSLLAQDYPPDRIEIIVINDHSDDDTAAQVKSIDDQRLRLLELPLNVSGKKAALTTAIKEARGEIMITTDADCSRMPQWLKQLIGLMQNGNDMVLAPVGIKGENTLLTAWQGLDVAGTLLLTGAAVQAGHPILANGANFAFRKTLFEQLHGFSGNERQASGDDVFLLQKAVRDKSSIAFAFHRQALVVTHPAPNWRALFWQRLRWAGKSSAYTDVYLQAFQATAYVLNLGLILGLLLLLFRLEYWPWVLSAWLTKGFAEWYYLSFATAKIGDRSWLKWLPVSVPLHSFYIVLIGSLALFRFSSKWKGRRV